MDWMESVRTYIKVVDEGSFNQAARKLNTTSSAVSKRIHFLEQRIGVQLLKRTTRIFKPNGSGRFVLSTRKSPIRTMAITGG